jgi:hypothetical protein
VNRAVFARALAVPLASIALLTLSWHYAKHLVPDLVSWLLYALYGLLFTLVAVACHRLVLLGADSASVRIVPRWSRRETKFAAWFMAVWAICMVTTYVLLSLAISIVSWVSRSALDQLGEQFAWMQLVAKLPAAYVFARLCLVLPAAAVDESPEFKWTWELTRNNGWRLVVVIGVLPWVISHLLGLLYRQNATAFEAILITLLGFACIPVEIAALSLSYRELTREPEVPPEG